MNSVGLTTEQALTEVSQLTYVMPRCLCVFQLKESKQAVNNIRPLVDEDEDEDDVEKVSWSGEPVGSKTDLLITSVDNAEL